MKILTLIVLTFMYAPNLFADNLDVCVSNNGNIRASTTKKPCSTKEISRQIKTTDNTTTPDSSLNGTSPSVYDADGQFVGYLIDVSNPADNNVGTMAIYSPTVDAVFFTSSFITSRQPESQIKLDTNGIPLPIANGSTPIFLTSNCTGESLFLIDDSAWKKVPSFPVVSMGYIVQGNDEVFNGKYYRVTHKGFSLVDSSQAYFLRQGVCSKFFTDDVTNIRVTNTLIPDIKEVKLPFTMPLNLPLKFTP